MDDGELSDEEVPSTSRSSRRRSAQKVVEALPINESSDESEDDLDASNVDDASDVDDIDDDQEGEEYLSGAKVWGQKRSAFYDTDYVDRDYGGVSESEEEAMDMEQEDALMHQKKIAERLQASDFSLARFAPAIDEAEAEEEVTAASADKVSRDPSTLSSSEQWEFLFKRYPDLQDNLQLYTEVKREVREETEPLMQLVSSGNLPEEISTLCKVRNTASLNLLMHLQFYLLLRLKQERTEGHPVLRGLARWKSAKKSIDEKYAAIGAQLMGLLSAGVGPGADPPTKALGRLKKKKRRLHVPRDSDSDRPAEVDVNTAEPASSGSDEDLDAESYVEETPSRRAITYEIAKNKGIMPKRRRDQRNPRVRYKKRHQKQLHRRRSQVPDLKKEIQKYGGEARGIRVGLVKSRKLK